MKKLIFFIPALIATMLLLSGCANDNTKASILDTDISTKPSSLEDCKQFASYATPTELRKCLHKQFN